jgi:hypothetical protein
LPKGRGRHRRQHRRDQVGLRPGIEGGGMEAEIPVADVAGDGHAFLLRGLIDVQIRM